VAEDELNELSSRLRALDDRVTAAEDRLRNLTESVPDPVVVFSAEGAVKYANRAAESRLGHASTLLTGEPVELRIDAATGGDYVEMRVVAIQWDGQPASLVRLHVGRRHRSDQEAAFRATHDALTGLPNRYLLEDRMRQLAARELRASGHLGVLYCDLDGLKTINDRFGHRLGDRVLVESASRIQRVIRPSDTAARVGGDEFVVLCEDIDESQVRYIADRLRAQFDDPIIVDGHELRASMSIGFALTEGRMVDPDKLIERSDRAMYQAKQGRHRRPAAEES